VVFSVVFAPLRFERQRRRRRKLAAAAVAAVVVVVVEMLGNVWLVPAVIITFCYANVVRVVWRHSKDEVQTSTKDGGSATLRRTVRDARYVSRAKIKTIKVIQT